jgi:hypothetical protein
MAKKGGLLPTTTINDNKIYSRREEKREQKLISTVNNRG